MLDTDVAVIGAGPYGLTVAAHLRRAGVQVRVLGDPMSFWRGMPAGMLLRSGWVATCIAERRGPLSLDAYCATTGVRASRPVPIATFIDYGMWVQQQAVPEVDLRLVTTLDGDGNEFRLLLSDGERLTARRVVVAAGIQQFASRPGYADGLPPELASHTGDHASLARFSGSRVLVVGGGQSALESAALLHESGARVEVVIRRGRLHWLDGPGERRRVGPLAPLLFAPTDVGPMGLSRLVAAPDIFRRLPQRVQDPLAYRSIRPAGAAWLAARLQDVPITLGRAVTSVSTGSAGLRVSFDNGGSQEADHLLLGTGYRVDIAGYSFLAPSLLARVRQVSGYPVLGKGMQSSVAGLHFVGAPAARSFGPTMRFVSGGWFTGRAVASVVAGSGQLAGHSNDLREPTMRASA